MVSFLGFVLLGLALAGFFLFLIQSKKQVDTAWIATGDQLGFASVDGSLQGDVDGVPVVVWQPNTGGAGAGRTGPTILVGGMATDYMENRIPEESQDDPGQRIDTDLYSGHFDRTGLQADAKLPYGRPLADVVRAAVAHYRQMST